MDSSNTKSYKPYSFATPSLREIFPVIAGFNPEERKALITISRSQQLPTDNDTVLRSKVSSVLPYIFEDYSPDSHLDLSPLTTFGEYIQPLVSSPYTAGMVIVICLEFPEDHDTEKIRKASWDKEMAASQTLRSESRWNWDVLVGNEEYIPGETIIHPDFPMMSPLQKRFRSSLSLFKRRIRGKRIFPHYTRRGTSYETGDWIRNRVLGSRIVKHGSRKTFFRDCDFSNITSKDVVHYFIRQGVWPKGRVEMRQQWSPNLLVPRTYFAWGGLAISVSSYLRTFFNDLVDIFEPTHRHNRVQPDWLSFTGSYTRGASFYFYDLTSFTSWFHEQVPLLRALSKAFRDVTVDLVWEGLTINEMSLSDMIDDYIRQVNDLPEFYYRNSPYTGVVEDFSFSLRHLCAGFLGVPGNLVTCTLGHGLAVAATQSHERHLQVPGDDVGALTSNDEHRMDVVMAAKSVGHLQTEKVYDGRQASVYLKRGVEISQEGVNLRPMVIYPISSMYIHPTHAQSYSKMAEVFRMPARDKLVSRAAQIMTTFIRDLWSLSHGNLSDLEEEVIIDFLSYLHARIGLPHCGIFQGQLLGNDEDNEPNQHESVAVKFPLDVDFLRKDPDLVFSDRYIESMFIRDVSRVDVTWDIHDRLAPGEVITVRQGRKWSFLRDMGYLKESQKIGGEKVLLIGQEAKDAYMKSSKPPYTCFEVIEPVTIQQLVSIGFSADDLGFENVVYDEGNTEGRRVDREYRHPLKYRDWDRPTIGGIQYEYGTGADPTTLMNFGNDSMDLMDLY